ncbi:FMN-binding protein [Pseudoflavonifractor intestinihominis]|uniref:FMN-binding protein n=1 Tax=Pseudoflavonifractor intestinihominis TaxID=3133171 RepID=A0ABV1E7P6_9FIRM|nr:FMN-binding protein [uncultured Pseudoflavonifractor sp.]
MIQKANKEENKVWKLLAPIVVLTCIGLVITAALAVTNQLTAPVIAAQQAAAADAALKVVLPDGSDFTDITGVELPEGVTAAKVAGNGAGYVFTTTGKGFGGDISVMVGLDANGAITGTKVLSNSETQGIGSKVVEDGSAFQQQLPGMTDTSGIQATSGATVSSNGMISAIQAAFDAYVVSTGGTVEATVYEAPANLTDDVLAEYYPGATFTDVVGGKVSDAGTVVYASENGMGGPVDVAVFFDANDSIIGAIADTSSETPDYGQPLGEGDFMDSFIGVTSGDEVDGVSGATITSDAIKGAVDIAIANLQTVKSAEPVTGGTTSGGAENTTGGDTASETSAAPANLTDDVLAEYYPGAAFTDVEGGKVSDAGTVVYAAKQGMMSEIKVAVLFGADDTILGIVADCSQETPGLGTLAGEEDFTSQFAGVTSADEVDSISGATVSSTAVKDAVNEAIANLQTVKEAG